MTWNTSEMNIVQIINIRLVNVGKHFTNSASATMWFRNVYMRQWYKFTNIHSEQFERYYAFVCFYFIAHILVTLKCCGNGVIFRSFHFPYSCPSTVVEERWEYGKLY